MLGDKSNIRVIKVEQNAVLKVLFAIGVRLMLLTHSLVIVWLATQVSHQWEYWLICLAYLGMVIETLVTVRVNKAQEWKWVCPCFLCYLICTVPGIWILELDHQQHYLEVKHNTGHVNSTTVKDNLTDVSLLRKNTLVAVEEQLFLYLMILARWLLPRGEISRDALSQLLFVFIGIASDITELFTLFEEDKVKQSRQLTFIILVVWTVSLLQFTLVLTSTNNPKKTRLATTIGQVEQPESLLRMFFQSEVWSITVNFLLQDGPFLAIRLYTMISLNVLTYSIIFFTAKNGLVVMLLLYRVSVVCCEHRSNEENRDTNLSTQSPNVDSTSAPVTSIEIGGGSIVEKI